MKTTIYGIYLIIKFQVLCINTHKWFRQDKTMTQSEEKSHEKFTLKYYVRDSENNSPQKNLLSCLQFATEAHKDQKRKDVEKTPYINHPIGSIDHLYQSLFIYLISEI
jgi:hypothetical protein